MKARYLSVRVGLMTFAVGLAAVWMSTGPGAIRSGVAVYLPSASEDVLYVFPTSEAWKAGGGAGGGYRNGTLPKRVKAYR